MGLQETSNVEIELLILFDVDCIKICETSINRHHSL